MFQRLSVLSFNGSVAVSALLLASCVSVPSEKSAAKAEATLTELRQKFAPDTHLAIYRVGILEEGRSLVVTGDVQSATAKLETIAALKARGLQVKDEIEVLPQPELGPSTWGIALLSICNGRENAEHKAELGTQLLMGDVVRIWKRMTNGFGAWLLTQSSDGYLAWQAEGNLVRCDQSTADKWQDQLLIVTALETAVLSEPNNTSPPVSDALLLNRMKRVSQQGDYYKVQLPDGRTGFLPVSDAEDYQKWKASRVSTAENIEKSARLFLGRPYLWGGNSPRGLDCSGFTRTVFALNGVDLLRNASHQARQGEPIDVGPRYEGLKAGDLLFFGRKPEGSKPGRISHVGIYLRDLEFIHSADSVHISSLDPDAPNKDQRRIDRFLFARRILAD